MALRIHAFGDGDPLALIARGDRGAAHAAYLRAYLADLGAASVLEETEYFDRDYLAEFAAFYAKGVRPLSNACRRLHFFAGPALTDALLDRALGGDASAAAALQEAYLGFAVIRPIHHAPWGRTVLRWYAEHTPRLPRVTAPSRTYACHVAGLRLTVEGLAWQSQDRGVSACATVALWSMFHSSAFDDHHAIPTTVEVTRAAGDFLKTRVFPSTGLTKWHLLQATKALGLSPVVLTGDGAPIADGENAFSVARFTSSCAAFVRSGYPVLIGGVMRGAGMDDARHAVTAVGFRECEAPRPAPGEWKLQDAGIRTVYLHDDNIGPSVRFAVAQDQFGHAVLSREAPITRPLGAEPTSPAFVPTLLLAAVHDDLHLHPDALHEQAIAIAQGVISATGWRVGLSVASRFIATRAYQSTELARLLGAAPPLLASVRRKLSEDVARKSLHLGVARIGHRGRPALDVLYDTTVPDGELVPLCHLAFVPEAEAIAAKLTSVGGLPLGVGVSAHRARA